MVYHEQKEQDWREQAAALQNEALHETAWQLIQRIRTLERKK